MREWSREGHVNPQTWYVAHTDTKPKTVSFTEDILPHDTIEPKFGNIASRMEVYKYIRTLIFRGQDGQDNSVISKYHPSLFSQLRIFESMSLKKPWIKTPFDMQVIRLGYPVRSDNTIPKESVSLNMRLYRLDGMEKTPGLLPETALEPWRELLFYQNLQRIVLHNHQSPHFPILYGYLFSRSPIQYDLFNSYRNDNTRLNRFREAKKAKYDKLLAEKKDSLLASRDLCKDVKGTSLTGVLVLSDTGEALFLKKAVHYSAMIGKVLASYAHTPRQAAAQAATDASNHKIRFDAGMLSEQHVIEVSPSCKVYVVRVNEFPSLPESLRVEIHKISPTSQLFDPWTQMVLSAATRQGWPERIQEGKIVQLKVVPSIRTLHLISKEANDPLDTARLSVPSGVSLFVLTESPSHTFLQWCSSQYNLVGGNRKMSRSGIYSDDIWYSIFFQVMQGALTLVKNGMAIRDMRLNDNVFIKDVPTRSNKYWIYVVDGVSYYVPYLGHVVLFDLGGIERDDFDTRVMCEEWGDHAIEEEVRKGLIEMFDPVALTGASLPANVNLPLRNILSFMEGIHGLLKTKDLSLQDVLVDTMSVFFHPRIGTFLTEQEKQLLGVHAPRLSEIKRGDLVAYLQPPRDSIWVYFLEKNQVANSGSVWIVYMDRESKQTIREKVSIGMLRRFHSTKEIEIFANKMTQFTFDHCLDRFVL